MQGEKTKKKKKSKEDKREKREDWCLLNLFMTNRHSIPISCYLRPGISLSLGSIYSPNPCQYQTLFKQFLRGTSLATCFAAEAVSTMRGL